MFDRRTVRNLLKKAFDYTANHDYANGFAIYEEDIRNCLYYNIRRALDFDSNWRVFSDIVIRVGDDARNYKPDLVFFSTDDCHRSERIELLVELKHWPSFEDVRADIDKLKLLKEYCGNDNPDIIFISITGNDKYGKELQKREDELNRVYKGVHIWLKKHKDLFQGPWDEVAKIDPWRKRLQEITHVSSRSKNH